MIGLLQQILCAIQALAYKVIDLLVMACNALFVALGAALALILGLLPEMPDEPDPPQSGVLAFVNWLVPLAPLLAFAATALALWGVYMLCAVALRWFRAL